mgnify:CR=1 FL=1
MLSKRDRRLQALELRKSGATFEQIGTALGVAKGSAYKMVAKALREREIPHVDELRKLEAERLDSLQFNLWTRARNGELGAIDRVVKILERRAKLLGLDVDRLEVGGPGGGAIPVKLEDARDSLAARIAAIAERRRQAGNDSIAQ